MPDEKSRDEAELTRTQTEVSERITMKMPAAQQRPEWWTDENELSWRGVKESLFQNWDRMVEESRKLERRLTEEAMAVGHGARRAYQKAEQWGEELESHLRRDWKAVSREADDTWDKVKDAVKHGWENTRPVVKAPPSSGE